MSNEFDSNRIKWLDVAKGICILLVIAGHVTKYKLMKTFIYSFHMPLFFILSGFTLKIPESKADIFSYTIKDIRRLLVPLLITHFIFVIYLVLFQNRALDNAIEYLYKSLCWGSTTFQNHKFSVGMLWFLVALFWGKQVVRIIEFSFPKSNNLTIYALLAYVGVNLPPKYVLPQCLDIAMVSSLFIYIGYLGKRYYLKIEDNWNYIVVISLLVWFSLLEYVGYINISGRWYSKIPYSIIMAIAASLCIIKLAQILSKKEVLCKFFSWCGINSLYIFCCQSLDLGIHAFWSNNFVKSMIVRSCICIGGVYVILRLKNFKEWYNHETNN